MTQRIQIDQLEPKAYKPLFELESYLETSTLSAKHLHLIKIKASFINGCGFCIDMHTKEALKAGESEQRIFQLNAFNTSDVFTDEEKALLQITEEITLIHQNGLSESTYNEAIKYFDEHYLAQIIMAICAINTWNRIAISTLKPF